MCVCVRACVCVCNDRLSSDAFNNLALVYSSLVVFGMKSEDLNVKVHILVCLHVYFTFILYNIFLY